MGRISLGDNFNVLFSGSEATSFKKVHLILVFPEIGYYL